MGQLIKVVSAVVLTGLLAVLGYNFIGQIFGEKGSETKAIATMEQGNHVISNSKIFELDNGNPPTLADIINNTKYTKDSKAFSAWQQDANGFPFTSAGSPAHCEAINRRLGYEGSIPSCSSVPSQLSSKNYYCCTL